VILGVVDGSTLSCMGGKMVGIGIVGHVGWKEGCRG
jgi:hypothetical protein